jgi:two-component system KDP operon response regulator KdpE
VSAPRILIVDDDDSIRRSLATELQAAGYEVLSAGDGKEGEEIALRQRPDLILTDLAMPVRDGYALIAAVRARAGTPIVVLSVRDQEADKIRALDLGADDYVTKPLRVAELLARVRVQLRRAEGRAGGALLEFPDLSIDLEKRKVTQGGREVRLTPTEFALLELLGANAGKPLTLRQIAARVWKDAPATTNDTVRVHVGSLRRKIEPNPSEPRYIVTEPWVGYRFIAEPV